SGAGASLTTGNYNIDIGSSGKAGESNTIRIGANQTATYIAGINGAISSGGTAVYVDSSGQLGTLTSSARFKENIQGMGDSSSGLMKLRPVRFRYKRDIDPSGLEQYGLVAEEVAKVYPGLVSNDAEGRPYTVRYQFLAPMLLNEVQKQAQQIAAQQRELGDQTRQLATLKKEVEELATLKEETASLQARLQALEGPGSGVAAQRGVSGRGVSAGAF
ncbi:MAG: tail fiber domain-containing protein, partial [Candidatus Binatia bacterium]